jgi:bifunctional DNA-binding transcriptional regulator/antitoxin component of YhaV-PrlF toxin-antitoxin module
MPTRSLLGTFRVGKDGEVHLPKEVREYLGVDEGDTLQAVVDETGEVGFRKLTWDEALAQLREVFRGVWDDVDPTEYVRSLRDEWAN